MIPDTAIRNESGQVAMKYRRQVPLTIRCGNRNDGYKDYVFAIRANIPLTWVDEAHVPCMSSVKWGCCGQKKPGGVIFANEDDVRRWMNNGGR
jgi:hypothetical protein